MHLLLAATVHLASRALFKKKISPGGLTTPQRLIPVVQPGFVRMLPRVRVLEAWFSNVKAATPIDGQEGEKESEVTGTKGSQ